MIVIHVGLKKSGSAWYYHMISEVAQLGGYVDATDVRSRFGLDGVFKTENNTVNARHPKNLLRLLRPHFAGLSFVVRAHRAGSWLTVLLARLGIVKVVFSYRDPLDVTVSLLEHAERARQRGGTVAHTRIHSVQDALDHLEPFLAEWNWWSRHGGALLVRYEDLLTDAAHELRRFRDFVGVRVPEEELQRIAEHYSATSIRERAEPFKRFHLNEAGAGRYHGRLSESEVGLCEARYGTLRTAMGY